MKLRIRALKIIIKTASKNYGVEFKFSTSGLNIIRADNSMGKSTIYNSIIYAMGLEVLIGNTRDIPLTYIVSSYVDDNNQKLDILESYVLLEIENNDKSIKTLKRGIVSNQSTKIIEVLDGPCITNAAFSSSSIEKYYAKLPGSAQNEKGFYNWFAKYLGWELPLVQKFAGGDTVLFMECIFPLFIVEQKKGWVQIQATVPHYGIKEVKQKALEFVMKLDTEKNNSQKRILSAKLAEVSEAWARTYTAVFRSIKSLNGHVENLSSEPVAGFEKDIKPILKVNHEGTWISLEDKITKLNLKISEVKEKIANKNTQVNQKQQEETLTSLEKELFQQEAVERVLGLRLNEEISEDHLLEKRIFNLTDDIRQMQDAFRISQLTGVAHTIENLKSCPVCDNSIDGTTLSQQVHREVMTVEDNLNFLKEELKAVNFLRDNCAKKKALIEKSRASTLNEVSLLREKIRALKRSLVEDDRLPSTALLQEKVNLDFDLKRHNETNEFCLIELNKFVDLSKQYSILKNDLNNIPTGLSEADEEKIEQLTLTLRQYLKDFEFKSFETNELNISRYTLQPIVEEFDWYFQASGSDNIRAIWAFMLALLSLSKSFNTNHLGFLMFDEPGQHSAKHESLKAFLGKAATLCGHDSQIIITTSETINNLNSYLTNIDAQKYFYPDKERLIKEVS